MLGEAEILEMLKKETGANEAYRRTEYMLYRDNKSGGVQEVRVEILDGGPAMGNARYHVKATSDDGRVATGNPDKSLETALAIVHWYDLDH